MKSVSGDGDGDGDGHIIITSQLPHKARIMVGPHSLYHMQPPLTSMEHMWQFIGKLDALKKYRLKFKDEVIEQCDGLPLVMHTVEVVIEDQILGKR